MFLFSNVDFSDQTSDLVKFRFSRQFFSVIRALLRKL